MNRILSVILALAMIASMLCVGASASYKEHESVGTVDGATTTVDGISYTVVTKAATLKTHLTSASPKNIILGGNIILNTSSFPVGTTITVTPGTLLEGNGYSIYAGSTYNRTAPLFQFVAGNTTTLRNVTFGTSSLPMKFTGAAFFIEDTTTKDHRVIWENVDFNLNSTFTADVDGTGAICCHPFSAHEFYGCDLTVNFSGQGLSGGWFGHSHADIYMNNCTTRGTVSGVGFTGGFLGQADYYEFRLINCVNYATVTGTRGTGGFIGNVGTGAEKVFFEYCRNYGAITCSSTGEYESMAGGFIGRFTSRQNCYFLACENHGAITSNGAAGGIAGRSHDYDYAGSVSGDYTLILHYRFFECLNTGTITATAYAGGIMGGISPLITNAVFENCANIGTVTATGASGYAGNMAGMLNNATLTNCYLMGNVTAATAANAKALAGLYANEYTAQSGSAPVTTGTAPVCTDCYTSKYMNYAGITMVGTANRSTVLAAMESAFGYAFVAKDSSDTSANPYQIATPRVRGMQTTKVTSGKQDIRLVAVINSLDAYSKIGFDVRIIKGSGIVFDEARESTLVYQSINNYSATNGTMDTITAESLGGRYIFAFTIRNVPTTEEVVFELTPYAVSADGTKTYTGPAQGITGFGGEYHEEAAILEGTQLSKYSIVYDADGTKGEYELAKHLATEIAQTTGYALPVFADNVTAGQNATHKLEVKTGANAAITASNGNVSITGDTAARLGEAIKYFVDQLNLRLSKGSAAWSFSSVSVPTSDVFSVMSYNMAPRNQNYSASGVHRYDALTDQVFSYLPDILTIQEPDRAFMQDSRMMGRLCGITSSSGTEGVENGSGYYSIYWGKARHTGVSGASGDDSVSVILWAKDRYTFISGGTFWLTRSNYDSPNKMADSEYYRCATWVKLTDKNTGKTFVVVNTHLDFATVNPTQINYLKKILNDKGLTSVPVLITGDLNSNPSSATITNLKTNSASYPGVYEPLSEIARLRQVNHYWEHSMIDWIFATEGTVEGLFYRHGNEITWYGKWNDATSVSLRLASDHPLSYAEMRFK